MQVPVPSQRTVFMNLMNHIRPLIFQNPVGPASEFSSHGNNGNIGTRLAAFKAAGLEHSFWTSLVKSLNNRSSGESNPEKRARELVMNILRGEPGIVVAPALRTWLARE